MAVFFTRYPLVFGLAILTEAWTVALIHRAGLDVTFLNWLLAGTIALTFSLALKAIYSLFR